MNCNSYSTGVPVSEVICSISQHECNANWMLPSGSDTGVISLSVFGTEGNRYSILVIEKEHLRSDYAGRDGKWFLSESNEGEGHIRFNLEWAAPAAGSGCLVLCGRETQLTFDSSA